MEPSLIKLWNREFSLLMAVQTIAMFANAVLSFALPLYILDISGSPALFGTVLALSSIPLVVLSPIGGVIADRGKRQRIMLWMDALTAAVIIVYLIISGLLNSAIPIIIVKLLAINITAGIYIPAAMSSVRFLVPEDKIVSANAISNTVFSLSSAIGPVIGGIFYATAGIYPVLLVCAALYVITAATDLFLKIPWAKREQTQNIAKMLINDLSLCAKVAVKEKPIIGKIILIMFLLSISADAMVVVGLPILATQTKYRHGVAWYRSGCYDWRGDIGRHSGRCP